ncbi:hypothetical protein F5888DRAFT_1670080 [Russula emetica]|nr:hypothetical protein F5888DRAFT_1670080 [Russula emetica]
MCSRCLRVLYRGGTTLVSSLLFLSLVHYHSSSKDFRTLESPSRQAGHFFVYYPVDGPLGPLQTASVYQSPISNYQQWVAVRLPESTGADQI